MLAETDQTVQIAECGHRSRHVMRIYMTSGWENVCVGCYRLNRPYYLSFARGRSARTVHAIVAKVCRDSQEAAG